MPDPVTPTIEFWYEFASTYSYPAAMRVEDVARAKGVAVRWRPFLLAPIFGAYGWTTSPFNIFPAKGKNMWRDLERICMKLDLTFVRPYPFPQNTLLAARIACALDDAQRPAFSRAVYAHEFGKGKSIDTTEILGALLETCEVDAATALSKATSADNKERLKAQTADAIARGVYGAPSFITSDGELFWGFDRLDDAVEWATKR